MNIQRLADELEREEGFVPHAYADSEGYLTIGIGTLIDQRKGGGITKAEGRYLLMNRIGIAEVGLDRSIPWWRELCEARQHALLQMAFQIGLPGLLKFKRMLGALEVNEFDAAARHALDSLWAQQTPKRAERIARAMRTGNDT